jgi:hypothetical protein
MAAFLLVALVIAAIGTARGIEQRLLLQGQAAIAQANIPYYDLEMRGRDAVVGGFIAEGTNLDALTAALRQVEGIREVRVEGVVGRVASQSGADGAAEVPDGAVSSDRRAYRSTRPASGTIEAELRIHGAGCLVRIDGRIPADGFAAELQQAFADADPCGPVEAGLWADESVKTAAWTNHPEALVRIVKAMRGTYRITAYGSTLRVFGDARNDAALEEIRAAAASMGDVDFAFVNVRPEPAGGAP